VFKLNFGKIILKSILEKGEVEISILEIVLDKVPFQKVLSLFLTRWRPVLRTRVGGGT